MLHQPDQIAARWDGFVEPYERVFEALTIQFAAPALAALGPLRGLRVLDVAAGAGGVALMAAAQGAQVVAIDGSPAMVRRIGARARGGVTALVADGMALGVVPGSFDVAISCFGVVLFPDPAAGMAEIFRALRPGGRVAVVTWTQPQRYDLSARLRAAAIAVRGERPLGPLPAQLRFIDPDTLTALLTSAGFGAVTIETHEAVLTVPDPAALAQQLAFAPGMAATLDEFGADRASILAALTQQLMADFADGPALLPAVAHFAVGTRP